MAPNYAMTARESGSINMGRFALLAQATHLVDCVLSLHRDTAPISEHQVTQLDKALNALLIFTLSEGSRRGVIVCCQSAVCYRYECHD